MLICPADIFSHGAAQIYMNENHLNITEEFCEQQTLYQPLSNIFYTEIIEDHEQTGETKAGSIIQSCMCSNVVATTLNFRTHYENMPI